MESGLDKRSNIALKSNIMVEGHKTLKQSCPGDLIAELFPYSIDSRIIHQNFSRQQIIEYHETLKCALCKRPCAGTCQD